MHSVLIVDDEAAVRALLARWLQPRGYMTRLAGDAEQALTEMVRQPATVALCDIDMPGRDGLWLAAELRRLYPDTAVVMASSAREFNAAVTSLRHGVIDFLVKPFELEPLCAAVARGVEWHIEAVEARVRRDELELDLRARMTRIGDALSSVSISSPAALEGIFSLLTVQDPAAYAHGQRVRDLSMRIAAQLGLPEPQVALIARAALLHDLGEVLIPPAIMYKTSALTATEQEIVRRHTRFGYDLIKTIPYLSRAADIVLASHEWFDGSGYPERLAGSQIPLESRIVACADAFDAMTCRDTYRNRLASGHALAEIGRCRGSQFDPRVADALLESFGHPLTDASIEERIRGESDPSRVVPAPDV